MYALPEPGTLIADKYRLQRLLGEGGMGAVFLARHELMDKAVALKWLQPGLTDHEDARDRFVREARAASRIKHPHVVEVYDVGTHGAALFMVMEFLQGQSFAELLREGGVAIADALGLLVQAMYGVAEAHRCGIVHRDIKPDNIFVVQTPGQAVRTAKILDFGISKLGGDAASSNLTGTGVAMGTPAYMSVEQMNGARDVDHRADVYSFGVLLYETLTGTSPFQGNTFAEIAVKVATVRPPPPSQVAPGLPPELDAIVMKAMAMERDARVASMAELIEALTPFAAESSVPAFLTGPVTVGGSLPQPSSVPGTDSFPASPSGPAHTHTSEDAPLRSRSAGLWLGLGLLLVGLGALFLLWPGSDPEPRASSPENLSSAESEPEPVPDLAKPATGSASLDVEPTGAASASEEAPQGEDLPPVQASTAPEPRSEARERSRRRHRGRQEARRKRRRRRSQAELESVAMRAAEVEASSKKEDEPGEMEEDSSRSDPEAPPVEEESSASARSGNLDNNQF